VTAAASGAGALDRARADVYRKAFGEPTERIPGVATPRAPAIDVLVHPPGHATRSFYTLVTSGMSDRPMHPPADVGRDGRRAELVLYVDLPGPSLARLLQTLARLPHEAGGWLGAGHTIPNGDPPAPLFPGSRLSSVLLLDSVVAPERDTYRVVEIEGDPLHILWPVPLTAAELAFKIEHGSLALLDVFNERQFSFVLDPGRDSLI
jgi:hypothetical protein